MNEIRYDENADKDEIDSLISDISKLNEKIERNIGKLNGTKKEKREAEEIRDYYYSKLDKLKKVTRSDMMYRMEQLNFLATRDRSIYVPSGDHKNINSIIGKVILGAVVTASIL